MHGYQSIFILYLYYIYICIHLFFSVIYLFIVRGHMFDILDKATIQQIIQTELKRERER